ncbi:RT0821/Lpp0805 family surface protein [Candidatus Marithrix sp. Canyon 246]|uniref:RT0821/Lpp0805 family surface protein n=1 Tax=Candidatus Marithrix sp. Canyon 246 TaxID=1827136 RepID=UPI000849F9A0|nr:RT0821/Lpp0805 family surface protein [Candidatus Marithrix sp. Canyon 246]
MKIKLISFLAVVSMFLVACNGSMPSKQVIGGGLGGVLGGVAGSQIGGGTGKTVAIVAGTLLGAALGGAIGGSMDQTDLYKTQGALNNTATGQTVAWTNPDNNNEYKVTPTDTYKSNSGQDCRDYTTVGIIGGQREVIKGSACRQADGSWKSQ